MLRNLFAGPDSAHYSVALPLSGLPQKSCLLCQIGHSVPLGFVLTYRQHGALGESLMLAEIFLLRLEAAARAAKESSTASSNSRFVPIPMPAVKAS
jgi:hypothetical protein